MIYRYRAFGPGGEAVQGELEAPGKALAMARLRQQGLLIEALWAAPSFKIDFSRDLGAPKLSLREQSVFFRQLAMLVSGGVPVLQALQVLANTSKGPLREVIDRVMKEVESGQSLSRALAAQRSVFPRVAVHVVGVAEMAGELDEGLMLLADQFDAEDQLQRKFRSALVYPSVVLTMAIGLACFMVIFIVPNFAGMFKDLGAELPWQTQALLAVSNFMIENWYIALGLLLVGVGCFVFFLRRSESFRIHMHGLLLKVSVFGPLIRSRETARYTRTLGTLIKSGVPVLSATQASAELLQNAFMAARLADVPTAIANGATLGRAIKESGALPHIFAELLVVGEIIGNTDTTLQHISTLADSDVKQTVERLTALLEPVLITLLGGIVLSVVVPLLLPMFDIYTKIK